MRKLIFLAASAALLAGCGDPLERVDKLSDVEIAETSPTASALPAPDDTATAREATGGLFAGLFGRNQGVSAPVTDAGATVPETTAPAGTAPAPEAVAASPDATPPAPRRGGFLGLFRARTDAGAPAAQSGPASPASAAPGPAATAQGADPEIIVKPARSGLFGNPAAQPASDEVPFGTRLPFGKVARVCGEPPHRFGQEIARYPERGRGWRIYDSDPGNTAPHTFYVTGFRDRCARQFTAALAVFGSAGMHEQLRYGLPDKAQPYSDTDKAYEKLKSRVCRVARKKPCGNRISQMEKSTVFVSVYERFGGNAHWSNLLLHDGELVATDVKGG